MTVSIFSNIKSLKSRAQVAYNTSELKLAPFWGPQGILARGYCVTTSAVHQLFNDKFLSDSSL